MRRYERLGMESLRRGRPGRAGIPCVEFIEDGHLAGRSSGWREVPAGDEDLPRGRDRQMDK